MCGRTGLSLNKDQLQCACSYKPKGEIYFLKPDWHSEHNDGKEYVPSYNIAPTEVTPVLVSASKYKNAAKTSRLLKPMMWGVIPPWMKGDYKNHNMSTNNCRLENIRESKLYSPILKNGGRCVVVVEGFYEWQTTAESSKTKHKQPFYIYASQEGNVEMDNPETWNNKYDPDKGWSGIKLLYMAGLYNIWQSDDKVVYSYAVITMESNKTLSWLHHRMPAILSQEEQIEAWLDIENVSTEMALAVLKPIEVLSWHKVSSLVNKSKNKSNNCIKKLPQQVTRNKCTQQTLNAWFTKCEKRKKDEPTTSEQKKVKK